MPLKVKLTVEEYHKIVETGIFHDRNIELLKGELIELSPEKPIHTSKTSKLFKIFFNLFSNMAEIRWGSPISLSNSEPQPDLVIAKPADYEENHPTPIDIYLVVEVSNTTLDYDLSEKRLIYAEAGIIEYWVVDIKNKQLIVFRNPQNGNYLDERQITSGQIEVLSFPSYKINVADILP